MGDTCEQVIGWPPVGRCRKTINFGIQGCHGGEGSGGKKREEGCEPGALLLYVKVTMDGVGVGRKVDLKALPSYESLSRELQKMFHVRSPLDPSGGFMVTYQDNEGDWMAIGDIPWSMFVSEAKRLRVMNLSAFHNSNHLNKKRRMC